jgi:Dolichyl-phosphate-mannose-protein mannosyltransferase
MVSPPTPPGRGYSCARMTASEYVTGAGWFLVTFGAVCAGAGLVVRRRLPGLRGAELALAYFVVITAGVMAVELLPLALGVLTRATPAVVALLALAVAWRIPRSTAAMGGSPATPRSHDGTLSWAFAALGSLAAVAVAVAYLAWQHLIPFLHVDTVSFHLPNVARWIQSGTVWQADLMLRDQAQAYYPNNGELVQLAAVLPWHNDFLVRWLYVPFMAMLALGTYALARQLRASPAAAALVAAVPVTLPIVVSAYEQGMPDSVMYSTWVAGLVFLLRHGRTGRTADLVLAGLGLGMAFGTKWYGVWAVAIVLAVWAAGQLLSRRGPGPVARQLLALTGLVAVAGGFWLVRNVVEVGNPVYPVKVAPLGVTVFDAPPDLYRELAGFTILDYAGDWEVWREFLRPGFDHGFGLAWVVLPLAALMALGMALRRRRSSRSAALVAATVVAAALAAVAYAATPYSALGGEGQPALTGANTRYGLPAVLLALPAVAWLVSRAGRWRLLLELAVLAVIGDGLRRSLEPVPSRHVAAAVVVVATAGALAALAGRFRHRFPRPSPAALGMAAAAGLIALGAYGFRHAERFNDERYRGIDPALAWTSEREQRRIGLTGYPSLGGPVFPILPAFGPRLANEVEQVAPEVDGMLLQYRSRRQFEAALRRGRYDLIVYADGRAPRRHHQEEAWLRSAGWVEVTRGNALALYRPGGP